MFTVGADPNWQQDKLARLMQALELARARRDQKKEQQQARAAQRFKLILSAAEDNPDALATPTVRNFVAESSALIPGLQEWYDLESAKRNDPNQPRNAYDKLLRGADAFSASADAAASSSGVAGMAGLAARAYTRAQPSLPFDAAAKNLSPSEQVRARQYARQTGTEIPESNADEPNQKISGPLYVVQNPGRFDPEAVRAARIQLQLEDPKVNPAEKLNGALYVLEHPEQYGAETLQAARYQLEISQPPWETKTPGDKLSGAFAVLNAPQAYSPEAVRYARAISAQTARSGSSESGGGAGREEHPAQEREKEKEKGQVTEHQAAGQIDDYVSSLSERFAEAKIPLRQLTPSQKRRAAQILRSGEDVDTYLVNTLLPSDGRSLDRVISFHVNQPGTRALIQQRHEDPKVRAQKLRADALREIQRLTRGGMNAAAARARVFLELLDGAP